MHKGYLQKYLIVKYENIYECSIEDGLENIVNDHIENHGYAPLGAPFYRYYQGNTVAIFQALLKEKTDEQ